MKYTTQSEYGLICLIDLMRISRGQPVSLTRIAKEEGLSLPYIEKIFSKMAHAGIVKSVRGARGGFMLARDPERTTFRDVIEALEGSTMEVFCSSGLRQKIVCGHFSHCGLQHVWVGLKKTIDDYFDNITLASLCDDHLSLQTAGGGSERNRLND